MRNYLTLTFYFLCLGEGGEAGRHCAGGSRHGAMSPRSGAGPPPRPVAASAAESSQPAAELNVTCAAPTQHHPAISFLSTPGLQHMDPGGF